MYEKTIEIKIDREIYKITDKDIFVDNGNTVHLLSQNKRDGFSWLKKQLPRLPKKVIKRIDKFERIPIGTKYDLDVEIFSLKLWRTGE